MLDPMMEPESSDSDVSVGGGDEYRFASPLTAPIPMPPPASKHALESPDAVQARLNELQRVEDHNVKKNDLLKAKRNRKDEKIRGRREFQDKKWAAILEARQRRDARIDARRRREDAAFSQFDHELEEEENVRIKNPLLPRAFKLTTSRVFDVVSSASSVAFRLTSRPSQVVGAFPRRPCHRRVGRCRHFHHPQNAIKSVHLVSQMLLIRPNLDHPHNPI